MARSNPNRLLVEGDEEKRLIPYLMDAFVAWGNRREEWVVQIEEFGGIENLLKPSAIEVELKTPGLQALGVLLDANDQFDSRWGRVRNHCRRIASDFPDVLPEGGLIHQTVQGLRIGVWIMPDNGSRGMLETFLSLLVRPKQTPLWNFAATSCATARAHGAPYTDSHRDKANAHTFLAWLDPPGQFLHLSVLSEALDARSPLGEQFARWFINLYQLTPRESAVR
jgi:hypothetical protein